MSSAAEIRDRLRAHGLARAEALAQAETEAEEIRALLPAALAAGIPKTEIAQLAQVSRPTLDAWSDEG